MGTAVKVKAIYVPWLVPEESPQGLSAERRIELNSEGNGEHCAAFLARGQVP